MGAIVQMAISAATPAGMLSNAAEQARQLAATKSEQVQERAGQREIIPGSELMTPKERDDYRRRYAAAKTDEERAKVRSEHVKAMEERARLRGLRLAPPVQPKGAGK